MPWLLPYNEETAGRPTSEKKDFRRCGLLSRLPFYPRKNEAEYEDTAYAILLLLPQNRYLVNIRGNNLPFPVPTPTPLSAIKEERLSFFPKELPAFCGTKEPIF